MTAIKNLFSSAFHLFYPHTCTGCGSDLLRNDELLCIRCIDALPHTAFEKYPHNPIERIFYGRLPLEAATAGFYFVKDGIIRHLIHELKYKSNKEIGRYMGRIVGDKMLSSGRFTNIDYLIPLPLFADREFKRGYNQAEIICNGLSEAMNIPVLTKNLVRVHATQTQTKKHRAERWENVSESFRLLDPGVLRDKHILLADDVITTGASIEACAQAVIKTANTKLSLVSMAWATK